MKKFKMNQLVKQKIKEYTEIFIASIGIATFFITIASLMSWNVKVNDERMIQEEYTKKTEMSVTQISQN